MLALRLPTQLWGAQCEPCAFQSPRPSGMLRGCTAPRTKPCTFRSFSLCSLQTAECEPRAFLEETSGGQLGLYLLHAGQ